MANDLSINGAIDPSDKNYYNLTVSGLLPATPYNLQFQWIFADSSLNTKVGNYWSNIYSFTTTGQTKPSAVTGLSATWEKGSLKVSFTHDTSLNNGVNNNTYTTQYKIKLTAGGISRFFILPVNKTTTSQVGYIDALTIKREFGLFQSQFTVSVIAIDSFNAESTELASTSTTYTTPLSVPVITATSGEYSYTVAWNNQDKENLEAIYIEEIISASETAPTSGYTLKKKSVDNPVYVPASVGKRWIRAYFVDSNGVQTSYSNYVSAVPFSADASDTTPPNEPSNLSAVGYNDSTDPSGNSGYILLTWTASSSADAKKYSVRFGRAANDLSTEITFTGTSGRIDNLRAGQTYHFQIAANDGVNDSSFIPSTPVSATIPADTIAPVAPSGLTAVAGFNNIIAYWNRNSELDVDLGRGTYQFQIDDNSDFSSVIQDRTITGTVASFTGLVTGTQYYIRVRAIDSSGNLGIWSASATATPGKIDASTSITNGTIVGDLIAANTIVGSSIKAGDIDADRLKTNTAIVGKLYVGGTGKITLDGSISNPSIYIGTGTYANSNTPVYISNEAGVGKFSLGSNLTWNGSTLSITGGFTVTDSSYITSGELGVTGATASIFAGAASGSGKRVKLTSSGLFGLDNSVETFSISNTTGNAIFSRGSIAGWDVSGNQIYKNGVYLDSANSYVAVSTFLSATAYSTGITIPTASTDTVLWAGQQNYANRAASNFRVTAAGRMYATDAVISGDITASQLNVSGIQTVSGVNAYSDYGVVEDDTTQSGNGGDPSNVSASSNINLSISSGLINSTSSLKISSTSTLELWSGGSQVISLSPTTSSFKFTGLYLGGAGSQSAIQNHSGPYITVDARMRGRFGAPLTYPNGSAGAYYRNIYIKSGTGAPSQTTGHIGDVFLRY